MYGKAIREPLKMLSCLMAAAFISWKLLVLSLMIAPVGVWVVHHLSQRMRNVAAKEARGMQQVFQKKLRAQIAIVSQSPVLFRGTVWDNIEYGKKNATHHEILAASQIARVLELADRFIVFRDGRIVADMNRADP